MCEPPTLQSELGVSVLGDIRMPMNDDLERRDVNVTLIRFLVPFLGPPFLDNGYDE
jgi:hypothetical protein